MESRLTLKYSCDHHITICKANIVQCQMVVVSRDCRFAPIVVQTYAIIRYIRVYMPMSRVLECPCLACEG